MKFQPAVLAAHAQFGGDLEDMQRRYDADVPAQGAWRPISQLTEEELVASGLRRNLVLWNSCNGPHQFNDCRDAALSANEIKREGVWQKYLILPEAE